MWSEAVFWPAAQAAGMLQLARAAIAACPGKEHSGYVDFRRPDALIGDGSVQSAEYLIRFQVANFPGLAEEDQVVIQHIAADASSCVKYRVRSAPFVPEDGTGFERLALLTKV